MKMKIWLVLFWGGCCVLSSAARETRILGGTEVSATDPVPYAASVRSDNVHICGGSIIASMAILTAAHCLHENKQLIGIERLSVRVGSTNQYASGRILQAHAISVHPSYNKIFEHNVALLWLSAPLPSSNRIQLIPLAAQVADMPPTNATISVAGWGRTLQERPSYKLRRIEMRVASEASCKSAYAPHDQTTLCLAHGLQEGTCVGDSGAGASYNGKLIGVANFVVGTCGSRYPDVFSNVAYYAAWIQGQLEIRNKRKGTMATLKN